LGVAGSNPAFEHSENNVLPGLDEMLETITPARRGNTLDPEVRNPAPSRAGRGHIVPRESPWLGSRIRPPPPCIPGRLFKASLKRFVGSSAQKCLHHPFSVSILEASHFRAGGHGPGGATEISLPTLGGSIIVVLT
jgi:hypothetical protein